MLFGADFFRFSLKLDNFPSPFLVNLSLDDMPDWVYNEPRNTGYRYIGQLPHRCTWGGQASTLTIRAQLDPRDGMGCLLFPCVYHLCDVYGGPSWGQVQP